jgi:phosphocarrier protein HPr
MVSQKVTIVNKSGIHARPASVLAQEAMRCKSSVTLVVGDRRLNAKSILNLMGCAIRQGTEVVVECDGENEAEDLAKVVALIESGLGEE